MNILLNPGDTIVANFGQGTQCYTLSIINPILPLGGTTPITQVFNGNNCDAEVCTNYCNPTPTPTPTNTRTPSNTPSVTPSNTPTGYEVFSIVNTPYTSHFEACLETAPDNLNLYFFVPGGSGTPACPNVTTVLYTDPSLTTKFDGGQRYYYSNLCTASYYILGNPIPQNNGFIESIQPC